MDLRTLLAAAGLGDAVVEGEADATCRVEAVTDDSRVVQPGTLFVAIRGRTHDGAAFLADVAIRGAVVAVIDAATAVPAGLPAVRVAEPREAFGRLCQAWAGHPSRAMRTVGVTGTDGKTSTCWMLRTLLQAGGLKVGLSSTVENDDGQSRVSADFTTPPADRLAAQLDAMRRAGCDVAIIELSSQGLDQRRAAGVRLAAAGWTNFGRDHLDDHGCDDAYFAAKARIAGLLDAATPLVVGDDFPAERLHAWANVERQPVEIKQATVSALSVPTGDCPAALRSQPFRRNAAVAVALARQLGVDDAAIERGLSRLTLPPGRLERFAVATDATPTTVCVDYAHTPAALAAVVDAVRSERREESAGGRLVVVTGAGGDRDRAKRPLMGAAIAAADRVVLTSDNPRSECPAAIAAQIAEGLHATPHRFVADRRAAIAEAVADAGPGGFVLVAGKGHETTQTMGDEAHPLSDRAIVAALARHSASVLAPRPAASSR